MKPPRKAPSRRQAPEALAAQTGGRAIVTSLEVAQAAGVSRATVSRCFTGDGLVRASTRDHVLSVAAALGYSPNLLARMLNKRESDIVAVLTADFRNPFQPALMEALTEGLCTDGLIPLLLKASSVDERADRLIQLALSYRVSAIIITVLSASPAVIKRCIDSHVPVIFLNRLVEDSAAICVATDSERGASRIAEVLVQGGNSRIAMITGKTGTWTNSMRRSGFRRRLDELGFDVMASQPGEFTYDGGLEAASSLLASYSRLDAIYACNDAMAFGALDAIRRFPSRSVPDDIAVIGFDDVPLSAWGAYRLSTIRQPIGSLIEHVRYILRRDDKGLGLAGETFLHEGCFVQRATTKPVRLRAGDIDLSAAAEREEPVDATAEETQASGDRRRAMGLS